MRGPSAWVTLRHGVSDVQKVEYHPSRRRYMTRTKSVQTVRLWRRFLSAAIDSVIYGIGVTIWSSLIAAVFEYLPYTSNEGNAPSALLAFGSAVSGWIVFGIFGDMGITWWFKRSLGKTIMGLMIVDARPDRWVVGTSQIVKRSLSKGFFLVGVGTGFIFDNLVLDGSYVWVFVVVGALITIPMFGIGRGDKRGLHDRLAGTEILRS